MARAVNKKDLLEFSDNEYDKLMTLLDGLSIDEINTDFSFDLEKEKGAHWARDKNVRDVLVHLSEWHKLLLDWVCSNLNGEEKSFLKDGYNWRTYGAMNQKFVEDNQDITYDQALFNLKDTHQRVMILAEEFSNDQLFKKDMYSWVGGSTLGSYFVSVCSSHYDWASKKILKFKKTLK